MLDNILKVFKGLNSNSDPSAIAHSVCLGFLLGVLPKNNIFWYVLFVFVFFMRINKSLYAIMILLVLTFVAHMDPLFDNIGNFILATNYSASFFNQALKIPLFSLTKLNNSIVMGSFVFSLLIYIPLYLLIRLFVFLWRKYFAQSFRNSKFFNLLRKIPIVKKIISLKEGF